MVSLAAAMAMRAALLAEGDSAEAEARALDRQAPPSSSRKQRQAEQLAHVTVRDVRESIRCEVCCTPTWRASGVHYRCED